MNLMKLQKIGPLIYEARRRRNLSRRTLSKEVGISSTTIKRIEQGFVGSVSLMNCVAILDALQIDLMICVPDGMEDLI